MMVVSCPQVKVRAMFPYTSIWILIVHQGEHRVASLRACRDNHIVCHDRHDTFNATFTEDNVLMQCICIGIRLVEGLITTDLSRAINNRNLRIRTHGFLCSVKTGNIGRTIGIHILLMCCTPHRTKQGCPHDTCCKCFGTKQPRCREANNETCNACEYLATGLAVMVSKTL